MKQLKFGQAVRVQWEDSAYQNGWAPPVGGEVGRITSIGHVVAHDKKTLTISSSISGEGVVLTPLTIPVGMIRKVEVIRIKGWGK